MGTTNVVQLHPPIDPCPFCGDKGTELSEEIDENEDVWVACGCCGAEGPVARVGCRDDEFEDLTAEEMRERLELEAITMWNMRGAQ